MNARVAKSARLPNIELEQKVSPIRFGKTPLRGFCSEKVSQPDYNYRILPLPGIYLVWYESKFSMYSFPLIKPRRRISVSMQIAL